MLCTGLFFLCVVASMLDGRAWSSDSSADEVEPRQVFAEPLRARGRPRKRPADDIVVVAEEQAVDRSPWHGLVRAGVRGGPEKHRFPD